MNSRSRPPPWWPRCRDSACSAYVWRLGGIGTKPWRSLEAEQVLEGRDANAQHFRVAAEAALRDEALHDNAFKVELAKRTLVRTLKMVTQVA